MDSFPGILPRRVFLSFILLFLDHGHFYGTARSQLGKLSHPTAWNTERPFPIFLNHHILTQILLSMRPDWATAREHYFLHMRLIKLSLLWGLC